MPSLVVWLSLLLAIQPGWTSAFTIDKRSLASVGRSDFFILEPGHVAEFSGGAEHLIITVLAETTVVDGVVTRVVEERETNKGVLVEVSRNYFAIDPSTKDVYYFGEDVDMYTGGKISGHGGSWRSGINGATFGLALPGAPARGQKYHQEVARGVAMDRAEIISLSDTVSTPAATFANCVKVEETTPLEPGVKEYKWYARGIGLVQDGDLKLVSRRELK